MGNWYDEGNVTEAIVTYLRVEGWEIDHVADIERGEKGVDIQARHGEKILHIEVKGYPTGLYKNGEKKGQECNTNKNLMATHYYGDVLLSATRRQSETPHAQVDIGFPDFAIYRTRMRETGIALKKLGVRVFLVLETGEVQIHE